MQKLSWPMYIWPWAVFITNQKSYPDYNELPYSFMSKRDKLLQKLVPLGQGSYIINLVRQGSNNINIFWWCSHISYLFARHINTYATSKKMIIMLGTFFNV